MSIPDGVGRACTKGDLRTASTEELMGEISDRCRYMVFGVVDNAGVASFVVSGDGSEEKKMARELLVHFTRSDNEERGLTG